MAANCKDDDVSAVPLSSTAKTHSLAANLDSLDAKELKETLLDLCQEDGKLRYRVEKHVDEMLNPPQRSRSPAPKASSPSPVKKRESGQSIVDRQPPRSARVRARKNGSEKDTVTIAAASMDQFLVMATNKLKLVSAAQKVFDQSGKRVLSLSDVQHDAVVYVSAGEPFLSPTGPRQPTKIASIAENSRLVAAPAKRVFARRNGDVTSPVIEIVARMPGVHTAANCFENLLAECTSQLAMRSACKKIFSSEGKAITDVTKIEKGDVIFASCGEPFKGPGDGSRAVRVKPLPEGSRLFPTPAKAIWCVENGGTTPPVQCIGNTLEKILDDASSQLRLSNPGKKLYDESGMVVQSFESLERNLMYSVSTGEAFVPSSSEERGVSRIVPLPESSRLASAPKVRLLAMKNGDPSTLEAVRIVVDDIPTMLTELTRKLGLTSVARKIFTADGMVIDEKTSLVNDQPVYVSCGEPFKKPGSIRAECTVSPIKNDSRLLTQGKLRVLAYKNGESIRAHPHTLVGADMADLLRSATSVLGLTSQARKLFGENGKRLGFDDLTRDMIVFVSCGEDFKKAKTAKRDSAADTFEPPSPREP